MSRLAERTLRARSLGYTVTEDGRTLTPEGRELKTSEVKGYSRFSIPRHEGDSDRTVYVHRLAALQWYGKAALAPGKQVRHLDDDTRNNARSNLALGTNTSNQMDIDPRKRRERATRASKAATEKNRKFTPEAVREIRQRHASGQSIKHIARCLGVSTATISYIVNRQSYRDIE